MEGGTAIKSDRQFQPAQFLAASFAAAIGIGTLLLLLPFSTYAGHFPFVDALFTATSAVCVTGLIVRDTATFFTPIGQLIIMILIQLGGLGIMTFSTLVLLAAGKKISIKDRLILQEGFHYASPKNIPALVRNIFLYTFAIELAGAAAFFICWEGKTSFWKTTFLSVFHSVSAFCNAGFSMFSNSFESYAGHFPINIILIMLIVLGGVGFLVINEGREWLVSQVRMKRFKLSLHTKIVVFTTLILIIIPWLLFLWLEWNHSLEGLPGSKKILISLFQIITPRTAGFNSMHLNALGLASISLLMLLMFIGASPGSTGGGIKTSTAGVLFAFLRSKLTARKSVHILKRSLSQNLIIKAFSLLTLSLIVISVSSFALFIVHPELGMRDIVFEVFSAFGTVGLSLGVTPKLAGFGKIVIILTMYVGRIGPLTLLYAFSRRQSFGRYEFIEENIMIG